MFGIENILLFIGTGILLNLYPGPDTLYILGRSVSQGRAAGVVAALGIGTGAIVHTLLGAFGLSALLATSAHGFFIVKILGGCYLLYQGICMLLAGKNASSASTKISEELCLSTIFRQGAITNILNPKVAIFFLAFIPQFIPAESESKLIAFLILGGIFITTGTTVCLLVAFFASSVSKRLRESSHFSKWLLRINGVLFACLGIRLVSLDLDF